MWNINAIKIHLLSMQEQGLITIKRFDVNVSKLSLQASYQWKNHSASWEWNKTWHNDSSKCFLPSVNYILFRAHSFYLTVHQALRWGNIFNDMKWFSSRVSLSSFDNMGSFEMYKISWRVDLEATVQRFHKIKDLIKTWMSNLFCFP